MNAIDLLKKQHVAVKDLFERLEDASGAKQRELFEELASNLVGHDGIERQIFYPACEKAMGMTDELGEALVEHGVVEFMLYQADEARGKEDFAFKCKVLQELLEHHIEEEEKEFFPKAKKALGDERLEELGQKMKIAFIKALEEDFRGPLHSNLKQVLAGAIKPKKEVNGGGRNSRRKPHRGAHQPRSGR